MIQKIVYKIWKKQRLIILVGCYKRKQRMVLKVQVIKGNNLNELFYQALESLKNAQEVSSVGVTKQGRTKTKELHPVMFELTNARNRVLLVPERGHNIFATVAETLWVLAGRNDLHYLSFWLPRAVEFSDDEATWRGAYGKRLFDYGSNYGIGGINQIFEVVERLKRDPNTRQAVFTLFDPKIDNANTKDVPCSNYGVFLLRDGMLDLTFCMRSNDVLWGFSHINVFEWTFIQELVAAALGVNVGKYYHLVNSFHIYEPFYEKADKILDNRLSLNDENEHYRIMVPMLEKTKGMDTLPFIIGWVKQFITLEFKLRHSYKANIAIVKGFVSSAPRGIQSYLACVLSYYILKEEGIESFTDYVASNMHFDQLTSSMMDYARRNNK